MKSYQDYPKINNDRINFSKISGNLELPYLVEIQTESYTQRRIQRSRDERRRCAFQHYRQSGHGDGWQRRCSVRRCSWAFVTGHGWR